MKHLVKRGSENHAVSLRNMCQDRQKYDSSLGLTSASPPRSPGSIVLLIRVIILAHMGAILAASFGNVDHVMSPHCGGAEILH